MESGFFEAHRDVHSGGTSVALKTKAIEKDEKCDVCGWKIRKGNQKCSCGYSRLKTEKDRLEEFEEKKY